MDERYKTVIIVGYNGNMWSIVETDKIKGDRYTYFLGEKVHEIKHNRKDNTLETRIYHNPLNKN